MTSYLMALDERIAVAAPSCYLTSFRRLMEKSGPQDAEQNICSQLAFGLGHADYVLMRAPKPTLMCCATRDFFDIEGSWDTFRRAKRFYTRMDFPQGVELVETDAEHGFSPQLRVGAVQWMRRWLLSIDEPVTEAESPVASDAELQCSPQGQVMRIDGARSAFDLNAELEAKYAEARAKFWQTTDRAAAIEEVRRITGIRKVGELPEIAAEKAGSIQRDGYRIEKLILRPEPGIALPALAFVPKQAAQEAMLYLHGDGKSVDAAAGGPIEKLALNDGGPARIVLAVDLRGIGETSRTGKPPKDDFATYFGSAWQDSFLAYMLGRPYLTERSEEILQCARFLAGYEASGGERAVHLVAIGECGPPALHAAALEPDRFASVVLRQSLSSWTDVVRQPLAKNQLVNVVHGALRIYDLPDLVAALSPEKVTVSEPVDALGEPKASK
jgi:pimeloyl-ACP methyl ester carboxylesterase